MFDVVELPKTDVSEEIAQTIEESLSSSVDVLALYDLSLLLNGAAVQPNGKLLVTLPAVEGDYDSVQVLYIADDGSVEACKTTRNADGTVSFETDHFSKYVVVGVKDAAADDGMSAGAVAALVIGISLGATLLIAVGGFTLLWFVIRKRTWDELVAVFKNKTWGELIDVFKISAQA